MSAKHEDAIVVVQLVRLSWEIGLDGAMKEIFSKGFDASDGSKDNESVRKVLHFGETVGTLVKHNVLDLDMVADLWDLAGLWNQVKASADSERKNHNSTHLYEHFESMASRAG